MAMTIRPASTIRFISFQATNTIGYVGQEIWPILFSWPRPLLRVEYGSTLPTRIGVKYILHNPSLNASLTQLEVIDNLASPVTFSADFRGFAFRAPLWRWTLDDLIDRKSLHASLDALTGHALQPRV
jgi:hypothetical protein